MITARITGTVPSHLIEEFVELCVDYGAAEQQIRDAIPTGVITFQFSESYDPADLWDACAISGLDCQVDD
jgi:hypothetical protein